MNNQVLWPTSLALTQLTEGRVAAAKRVQTLGQRARDSMSNFGMISTDSVRGAPTLVHNHKHQWKCPSSHSCEASNCAMASVPATMGSAVLREAPSMKPPSEFNEVEKGATIDANVLSGLCEVPM